MADIKKTYTIPEERVSELIDVFGEGYQEQIPNPEAEEGAENVEMVDNPQSRAQYASQNLDNFVLGNIKARVKQYRKKQRDIAEKETEDDFEIINS